MVNLFKKVVLLFERVEHLLPTAPPGAVAADAEGGACS